MPPFLGCLDLNCSTWNQASVDMIAVAAGDFIGLARQLLNQTPLNSVRHWH